MLRRSRFDFPLTGSELFSGATRAEMRAAQALLTQVTVGAGRVLLREGTPGRQFLIVADGLVSVARYEGDESTELAVVDPVHMLGEMSLLTGGLCSATATTLTPTTVFAATPQEFFGLLEDVPSFASHVIETATARAQLSPASPSMPELTRSSR